MSDKRFSGPNWDGGPLTCRRAHLPAFPTMAALSAFQKEYCPSAKAGPVWQCKYCGQFHCDLKAPDPAGASSGTGRSAKGDHDSKPCPKCGMPFYEGDDIVTCPTCGRAGSTACCNARGAKLPCLDCEEER